MVFLNSSKSKINTYFQKFSFMQNHLKSTLNVIWFTDLDLKALRRLASSRLRASRARWVPDSVMREFAMCISVRGWKVRADYLNVQ